MFKLTLILSFTFTFLFAIAEDDCLGLAVGESEYGSCYKITCHAPDDLRTIGCADFVVLPPCQRIEGDLNKPYPDCCPQVKC